MNQATDAQGTAKPPQWKPIGAIDRRLLGVLVEKAKTTQDQYPLSINALKTGSNQKSNRSPQMSLEEDQIEEALERLREMGAVGEISGSGRVVRYRHYLYDWLGVDKTELAVMAELLLRGAQTVGELRGRAARMEPIADVAALRPILRSLIDKGLVISLTPEGRGQVVSHMLYRDEELAKVRREFASDASSETPSPPTSPVPATSTRPEQAGQVFTEPTPTATVTPTATGNVEALREELAALREEVSKMRNEIEDIWSSLRS